MESKIANNFGILPQISHLIFCFFSYSLESENFMIKNFFPVNFQSSDIRTFKFKYTV